MKSTEKKPFLDRASSFVWALIMAFAALILFFLLVELVLAPLLGMQLGETVGYLLYGLVLGISGFIICKHNPKSVWYVILILNIFTFLTVIGEYRTIVGTLGILNGIALLFSIIGAILGARTGKKQLRLKVAN